MRLPKAEEQLMKYLWKLEKAFMKELLDEYPSPKPANTTIATLLRRLINRKVIDYKQYGNVRQYYPILKKKEYFSSHLNGLIKNFFNDSASQFASFFTNETDISEEELIELRKIIDKKIETKVK